jgi:hypothetical protein
MDALTSYNESANTPYLTYLSASLSNSIQSNIPITPLNLSTLYRTFTTKLKQAAKQHIPSRTHCPNSDTKHYNLIQQPNAKAKKAQLTISKQMRFLLIVRYKFKENKPITSAILLRFHHLAREYNLNIQANLDTLIRQLSNKLEKTIRQINNASLKHNIQNRTRNFSTQTKNHIKNIMNKQSSFKGLRYIRNPDDPDSMITAPPLIKTCIRNLYATLFDENDSNPPLGNTQHWFRPLTSITSQDMEMLAYPITKDELDSIIKNSGNRRAPGPDTITYEYFKCLSPEGSARQFILVLFNYLLHFAISPSELGRAIIILLQKTDGE